MLKGLGISQTMLAHRGADAVYDGRQGGIFETVFVAAASSDRNLAVALDILDLALRRGQGLDQAGDIFTSIFSAWH